MPLNEIKRLCQLQRDALKAQEWDLIARVERQKREILRLNFPLLPRRPSQDIDSLGAVFELCKALREEVEREMENVRTLLMAIRPSLNTRQKARTAVYLFEKV